MRIERQVRKNVQMSQECITWKCCAGTMRRKPHCSTCWNDELHS